MRKDVIPVEDAQGGPRSPRRFLRLLALLLAAFALLSAVWYFTAYRALMFTWKALAIPGGGRSVPSRGAARMGRVTTVMWPGLDFSIGRGIWGLACRT